ncbi:MAG: hypothetical protein PHS14_18095 [Elusimicrobia bacterium]|nr:hypothetical protein [Elusimicrobiota bacterium]
MRSAPEVATRRAVLASGYVASGSPVTRAEAYAEAVLAFEEILGLTLNAEQQARLKAMIDRIVAAK